MNNLGELEMAMNKKIVIVIGLGILISGCLNANKEKNYNFIKGLNEYQKNDKVSALENYKKAYELDKNNVVLLYYLINLQHLINLCKNFHCILLKIYH